MSIKAMKSFRKYKRIADGAAAVEFALIAPLFLLILGGIIEFGQAFKIEHLLSNACRRGARTATISGSTTSQVQTNVKNQCETMLGVKGADVTVNVLVNGTTSDVSTAVKGDQIDVEVSIPYSKAGAGFFTQFLVLSQF
jgi:Flp pilus assembly protein TadG